MIKAFPHIEIKQRGNPAYVAPTRVYHRGMDLRDYFAGQALIGCVNNAGSSESIAENCYRIADAMIEERKRHKSLK